MAPPLPIYEIESALISVLKREQRLIISAPTGSGKSTQVPQMLLDRGVAGEGQVVILQPRRLAARLLAARVARERNAELGKEVGYQIRFENFTSARTRIRFVTEGVLLRQMVQQPDLPGVSALIFDEFHERHLYGDVSLGQALELQETRRPDLKVLVMSATLELPRLREYLAPCETLEAHGRTFPVEIQFSSRPSYLDQRPIWEQVAETFVHFVRMGGEGDVLIFMPGGFEIRQTIQSLGRFSESKQFILLPLHGELPAREQDAAVASYQQRKVVVATNVAETSLTIEGIRCVIDSGLARIPRYDPYRGINTLLIEKISRASADQRAGRAGRLAPGICFRLWSEAEHPHRPSQELPEIKRLDLAEVALTLKAAGVENLRTFRWLDPPEEKALADAENLLTDLGALESVSGHSQAGSPDLSGSAGSTDHPSRITHRAPRLTPLGRKMLSFPVHPRYARLLLAAHEYGCVYDACQLAALTQGRELLIRNVDAQTEQRRRELLPAHAPGDFWLLRQAWNYAQENRFEVEACRRLGIQATAARQIGPLMDQFLQIARREGLNPKPGAVADEALQKCILLAFSDRVARRVDSRSLRCELVHGRRGTLSRDSVAQDHPLLVAAEIREIEGKDKTVQTVLSLATAIQEEWLSELFPNDILAAQHVFYDSVAKRVCAEEQVQFRQLPIATRRLEPPPRDAAAKLLTSEVVAGRLTLDQWDDSVDQWILRLNFLSQHCPELGLPPIGEEERLHLIEQICHGAFGQKDLKEAAVKPLVQSWLTPTQQRQLDEHAPERLRLTNGRSAKVTYGNSPPFIALRIQELYDVKTTPRIALGRVPLLVHILAPSRRPVQITQDLPSFWRDHYPKIKRELQRKYPKHQWR